MVIRRKEENMGKRATITVLCLLMAVLLASCARGADQGAVEVTFTQISQEEAKRMMDTETGYVILDVRTQQEYDGGHIPSAILLPYDQIPERAEGVLKDKGQKILVYCRSGNRSKTGSTYLVELGYTNVYEFGGINTWPYEIVK